MTTDRWDPDTYARFAELRARPFWELVDAIDNGSPIDSMVDLGCGSGELTAELASRLGARTAIGIDSSEAMLERADARVDERCRFELGDISSWNGGGETFDLVVANASLHWVGDHPGVLARWLSALRPGGQLAVQVPANGDHPSHTCSAHVATSEPFLAAMGGSPTPDPVVDNVLTPERYAEVLHALGVADPRVWLRVYPQVMDSSAQVVEWTRGTSLTRFFRALPDDLHEPFVDAYREALIDAIGDRAPYLYTFKRILMVGRVAG